LPHAGSNHNDPFIDLNSRPVRRPPTTAGLAKHAHNVALSIFFTCQNNREVIFILQSEVFFLQIIDIWLLILTQLFYFSNNSLIRGFFFANSNFMFFCNKSILSKKLIVQFETN